MTTAVRIILHAWLCLFCSTSAFAQYQAVLNEERVEKQKDRNYALHFLSESGEKVLGRIELGQSPERPLLFKGDNRSRMWVALRNAEDKHWHLIGYSTTEFAEIGRYSLGTLPGKLLRSQSFSVEESADNTQLHIISRSKNKWRFSSHDISSGRELFGAILKKGSYKTSELEGGRWLVEVWNSSNDHTTALYLFEPSSGKVLLDQKIQSAQAENHHLSTDTKYLYLINRERVGGQVKVKDSRFKVKVSGDKTSVQVIRTEDGKTVSETPLGYNLFPLQETEQGESLLGVTQNTLANGGQTFWRFSGANVERVAKLNNKCDLKGMTTDWRLDLVSVYCKGKGFLHGRLSDIGNLNFYRTSANFGSAVYTSDGKSAFVFSSSGDSVSKLDLGSGRRIESRKTVPPGVRLRKLATAGLVATATMAASGGLVVIVPGLGGADQLAIAQHPTHSERLYVLAKRANRVSVFAQDNLKRVTVHKAPGQPLGLITFPEQDLPWVFYVAKKSVHAFAANSQEPVLALNRGNYLGANGSLGRLYFNTGDLLEVRSLATLETIAEHPQLRNAVQILTASDKE